MKSRYFYAFSGNIYLFSTQAVAAEQEVGKTPSVQAQTDGKTVMEQADRVGEGPR